MFEMIKKARIVAIHNMNAEIKSEMKWQIGVIRGLVEHYNYAIVNRDLTSESVYEQELREREARLNDLKTMLA